MTRILLIFQYYVAYSLIAIFFVAFSARAESCPADRYSLWSRGLLRGVNIFQGRNPAGGPNGFGDGEFTQADLNDLAGAGANFVQISHAGIFGEYSPYLLDAAAEENLDKMIAMASAAGLYIGIAFRSGPGRNEAAITDRGGAVLEDIWNSAAARQAWAAMLQHVSERYKGDPHIVGYSVMVEPNAYAQEGYPGPEEFYGRYKNSLKDVNRLYALATAAIREVDTDIPILLEPEGFGGVTYLPYLRITGDSRTIYTVHDYTPFEYTNETEPGASYPGSFDIDGDGQTEVVDAAFLTSYLNTIKVFSENHGVPVAVTEFGAHQTLANATQYLSDRLAIQNDLGSWAAWVWQPAGFNDPFNLHDSSALLELLKANWAQNCDPIFTESSGAGVIRGRVFTVSTKGQVGKILSGVRVRARGIRVKISRSSTRGRFLLRVKPGSYRVSATTKAYRCVMRSPSGGRVLRKIISQDQTLRVNIFCYRKSA